jgi:hypothetical protein
VCRAVRGLSSASRVAHAVLVRPAVSRQAAASSTRDLSVSCWAVDRRRRVRAEVLTVGRKRRRYHRVGVILVGAVSVGGCRRS